MNRNQSILQKVLCVSKKILDLRFQTIKKKMQPAHTGSIFFKRKYNAYFTYKK